MPGIRLRPVSRPETSTKHKAPENIEKEKFKQMNYTTKPHKEATMISS